MTFQDEAEVRRPSVGTKVLIFGCAILAVLGSFWSIVWFIRAYVEAPRVGIPATMAHAARESAPVVPPTPTVAPTPIGTAEAQPASTPLLAPSQATAQSTPAAKPGSEPAQAASNKSPHEELPAPNGAIADRWLPVNPPAAEPAPAPAPTESAPATLATAPDSEPPIEEVAESAVPSIAGTAPLPRRKPTQTAAIRSRNDPPLPRPRPDGPAPQSVWTAVPTTDDRFPPQ
jgi:cytoskeletal protein RodZ